MMKDALQYREDETPVMSEARQPKPMKDKEPRNMPRAPARAAKKRRLAFRIFRGLMVAGLCVFAITAAINAHVVLSTRDKILTMQDARNLDMDCVMVLGAGLRRDGTPSAMLADRLRVGIGAFEEGAAPVLLMSGDHGKTDYDEVNAMKAFAVERSVPSSNIFMDHAGFSTYESMYRARDIFRVEGLVIVTQRYHLYRAVYNAERMGLEAYGISSDLQRYANQRYFDFREYLARVKDFVWGVVQPPPTYLGEPIPITGDGDVTSG